MFAARIAARNFSWPIHAGKGLAAPHATRNGHFYWESGLWTRSLPKSLTGNGFLPYPSVSAAISDIIGNCWGNSVRPPTKLFLKPWLPKLAMMLFSPAWLPLSRPLATYPIHDNDLFKAGIPRNFQIFDPLDFIAEVTQHIPNKGEHQIRYYGWLASRRRKARRVF